MAIPNAREDINISEKQTSWVLQELLHYLQSEVKAKVQEVGSIGHSWTISLFGPCDRNKLLMKFANLPCKFHAPRSDQHYEATRR